MRSIAGRRPSEGSSMVGVGYFNGQLVCFVLEGEEEDGVNLDSLVILLTGSIPQSQRDRHAIHIDLG